MLNAVFYVLVAIGLAVIGHFSGIVGWVAEHIHLTFRVEDFKPIFIMMFSFCLGILFGKYSKPNTAKNAANKSSIPSTKPKKFVPHQEIKPYKPKPKAQEDEVIIIEPKVDNAASNDAISALVNLGYTRKASRMVVAKVLKLDPEADLNNLIKKSMQQLSIGV